MIPRVYNECLEIQAIRLSTGIIKNGIPSPAQNTTAVVWDVQETNSNDRGGGGGGGGGSSSNSSSSSSSDKF